MRAKATLFGFLFAGGGFLCSPAFGGTSLGLAWNPSPDSVQGYKIYFGVNGGTQTNLANVGNVTNVVLQNLDAGKNYFFFATAYANQVESDPTPRISYTTPVNNAPTLAPIADGIADEGKLFQVKASASDSDVPAQTLRFSLGSNAPAGAAIDVSTGAFSWTPASSQAPSANRVTIVVTDNGNPPLSASQTFGVLVREGFYLTVNPPSNGTIQINPKGTLNQAGTKYINGTKVSASAQASLAYGFDHWTLNGVNYMGNPLNFTMTQNQTLSATFKLLGGVLNLTQSSASSPTTTMAATSPTTTTAAQPAPTSYTTTTSTNQNTPTNALVLESSTNLVDWKPVAVAPTATTSPVDTNAVYRITTVPLTP
jgi:hypothetical protein